jgi:hypothetical protein
LFSSKQKSVGVATPGGECLLFLTNMLSNRVR